MANTITLTAEGDRVFIVVPQEFFGPFSSLVGQVRQQIPGLTIDWTALREAFRYGRGRPFPIAFRHPDLALDEKAKIRFDDSGLTAYLLLYPPKPRGNRLEEEDLIDLTRAYGIPNNLLDLHALRMCILRKTYQEAEPVARGRPAVDGSPARVAWVRGFPSDPESFLQAYERAGAYPEEVLAEVARGEVVGARTPPDNGVAGVSATGEPIPARPGIDPIRLGHGLVLSPDSRSIVAREEGYLRQVDDPAPGARVAPLLRVRDPLELRDWAENVYPGSIVIEGDLEIPFPLRVMGDMEVRGGVIRSSLDVMGSLFVRDGVIQHRRDPLRVGGIISAAFFERTEIIARVVHVRRYSLKSRLTALEMVVSDHGAELKGGQLAALGTVQAGCIGASNHIATEVVLGVPALLDPFREMYAAFSGALEEEPMPGQRPPPALLAAAEEWEGQAAELAPAEPLGCVLHAGEVHPGVTVRIGPASREIQSKIGPVEMRYERIGPRGRVSMTRE